jgi:starch synthase
MKILMVASEAAPYAKTGGLADVIGSLPAALAGLGEEVAVVLPLYKQAVDLVRKAERVYDDMRLAIGSGIRAVSIRRLVDRGVHFYFIDDPDMFDRDELYTEGGEDYPDNALRFAVLCYAALGVVRYLFRPKVVHYHDWQASLVAPLLRRGFAGDPTFYGIKLLLTIHNMGYQGLFPKDILAEVGLPEDLYHRDALEFHKRINLLKGGIVFADAINTVSRGYAREIQTEELGFGLDGLLRSRSEVLCGILNGVDYGEWSPETDKYIAAHYTADDLTGKKDAKRDLLRTFGFANPQLDRPVIGIVSRFVDQKGFDLVEEIAPELAAEDVYLVGIGSGVARYEEAFRALTEAHPENVAIRVGYDNEIAHKIEAGSDIFLMPSRYEPCGLNQIYSLRYGTVPVVRATGGLDDTIEAGTGFKFTGYSGDALLEAIRSALAAYRDRERWAGMVKAGMAKDFSWSTSAAEYMALYRRLAAG